jgi:hypothetical protein
MTIKTLFVTAALAVLPFSAWAQCAGKDAADQQAMSCLPGTAWDIETGACIPVASS